MAKKQGEQTENTIPAGYMPDYLTGGQIKETKKELVRQREIRAFIQEYQIFPEDMALDFPIDGRKKADVVIFHHDKEHTLENISRIVVCCPEPTIGSKTVRIRDPEQAETDLEKLKELMMAIESCEYGLWTNGLDLFFLQKTTTRFEVRFNFMGAWPLADESLGTKEVYSDAHTRISDPEMLKITFRRCHNYIHGNEGMPKDAAFWQFLYLIFCKMYDENLRKTQRHTWQPRFWAGLTEQFKPEGQKAISGRIKELFEEVKNKYDIFHGNEEITLSDRALAFIVSELARYDFLRSSIDAKGAAYQELVGVNLRGDRGQYFTPRGVIDLMVEMLDPKNDETILDPACGTGGFLVSCIKHMKNKIEKQRRKKKKSSDTEEFFEVDAEVKEYSSRCLFGADFDPFLIRASKMNMVMSGDGEGHLYHVNSLEFPNGYLVDTIAAKEDEQNKRLQKKHEEPKKGILDILKLGSFDIVMTNPPFGSKIPVTDHTILQQYELAHDWEKDGEGGYRNKGALRPSVSPEILFLERCIKWLKPGKGRMGIVLPNGILGNPGDENIRWWVMQECEVLASIDLPVETFIAEAGVNILTSLLFLRRKSNEEKRIEALKGPQEYTVFMAVADKVGVDRRGNKLFKRTPDGEEIVETVQYTETIRGKQRTLSRKEKIPDNDLLEIAKKYREFLEEHD
ncbi:MAG: N-6 DNA methylase [Hungatella sp.]|jgi:type I restriction enzyme M protein|nr:N-6 DNA methylase [Hungatella sp.]